MKDIEEAATLVEEALLAINTKHTDQVPVPVCDRDLHNTTEAYRLSLLLQLYESFPRPGHKAYAQSR